MTAAVARAVPVMAREAERARALGLGSPAQIALCACVAAACACAVTQVNGYYVFVLANVALMAIVGVGLNVLIGFTGQVSFGHVGFYAIGAYAVAILTTRAGLSFWLAWPIATVLAAAAGAVLAQPALRAKGPYLAMITIAFGFIVEHGAIELRALTGGQNGLMNLPRPALVGFAGSERTVAVIAIASAAGALTLFRWLSLGAWGAAMRAVRDAEGAAESVGIDPTVVKTVAFAVSAALAGLAGGLFAPLSGFVTPSSFAFLQSILFVLVVMIGGAGSFAGPVVGAVIVGVLPELLASLEDYRLLFFGALLLVVLWIAPDGVVGLVRRTAARWRSHRRDAPAASIHAAAPMAAALRGHGQAAARTLAVSGLTMDFGGLRAVSDLSLTVPPAAITGLIGPNGAGKTTALNMLSGYYRPTAGTVALGDEALAGRRAFRIARSGVARTYQTSQLFGSLGVADNVALAHCRGRLGGLFSARTFRALLVRERAAALLAFCGYAGTPDALAADLPHVDRRLVEIARALATNPDALLLDEPAAGLSHDDKGRLGGLLRRIADAGIGVVLVEHDMHARHGDLRRGGRARRGQAARGRHAARHTRGRGVRDRPISASSDRPRSIRTQDAASAASAPEALGVGQLTAGYGAEPVLRDVDLQVRRGETVALLGANGAGKSTLMRALAGLHRPVGGGIHFEGRDLVPLAAERIAGLGVILVPEGRQVFPDLSVLDNLRLGAFLKPRNIDARIEAVLARFPRLRARLAQRAGLLSGGEQQMLALARGSDGASREFCSSTSFAGACAQGDRRVVRGARCAARRGDDRAARRSDGGTRTVARRSRLRNRFGPHRGGWQRAVDRARPRQLSEGVSRRLTSAGARPSAGSRRPSHRALGTRPSTKNSGFGRMAMRFAIRFDSAKNAAMPPMSQMSSSLKPWPRSDAKSSSSMSALCNATFSANASIAFCRGVMSALR